MWRAMERSLERWDWTNGSGWEGEGEPNGGDLWRNSIVRFTAGDVADLAIVTDGSSFGFSNVRPLSNQQTKPAKRGARDK